MQQISQDALCPGNPKRSFSTSQVVELEAGKPTILGGKNESELIKLLEQIAAADIQGEVRRSDRRRKGSSQAVEGGISTDHASPNLNCKKGRLLGLPFLSPLLPRDFYTSPRVPKIKRLF